MGFCTFPESVTHDLIASRWRWLVCRSTLDIVTVGACARADPTNRTRLGEPRRRAGVRTGLATFLRTRTASGSDPLTRPAFPLPKELPFAVTPKEVPSRRRGRHVQQPDQIVWAPVPVPPPPVARRFRGRDVLVVSLSSDSPGAACHLRERMVRALRVPSARSPPKWRSLRRVSAPKCWRPRSVQPILVPVRSSPRSA